MPRRLLLIAFAVLAAVPGVAEAADTHAPKGARGDWLPRSEWVMSSWLPFDEARLYELLGTDRPELASWLNDRRTLGQLAAKRGLRRSERACRPARRAAPAYRLADDEAAPAPALARHALAGAPRPPRAVPHLPHARDPAACVGDLRAQPRSATAGCATAARRRSRSPRSAAKRWRASRDALLTILAKRDDQGVRSGAMSSRQARTLFAHQQDRHRDVHAAPLPHACPADRVRLPTALTAATDACASAAAARRRSAGPGSASPSRRDWR